MIYVVPRICTSHLTLCLKYVNKPIYGGSTKPTKVYCNLSLVFFLRYLAVHSLYGVFSNFAVHLVANYKSYRLKCIYPSLAYVISSISECEMRNCAFMTDPVTLYENKNVNFPLYIKQPICFIIKFSVIIFERSCADG